MSSEIEWEVLDSLSSSLYTPPPSPPLAHCLEEPNSSHPIWKTDSAGEAKAQAQAQAQMLHDARLPSTSSLGRPEMMMMMQRDTALVKPESRRQKVRVKAESFHVP
eukprot:224032-Rhodomonas_salina.1